MAELVWDQLGTRVFETGIDRAVLYSPNHPITVASVQYPSGFAWNGLTEVNVETENAASTPVYFDGVKTFDLIDPGDFSASIKAITYPDEFIEYDGYSEFVSGMFLDNQPRNTFGLSYRTLLGNDLEGIDFGYKIHLLYNLTAISDSLAYQTVGSNVDPINFGWTITGVPEVIPGFRPTAHLVLDSTKINPTTLLYIEDILYGTNSVNSRLPTMTEVLSYVTITITDNGDGTWTATGPDYLVSLLDPTTFQIEGANVIYLDSETYTISST